MILQYIETFGNDKVLNKLHLQVGEKSVTVDVKREMNKASYETVPKPQRQQKPIRSEKVSVKETMAKVDSGKAVKKPEKIRSSGSLEKPHPIQLPPAFKNSIFGKVND